MEKGGKRTFLIKDMVTTYAYTYLLEYVINDTIFKRDKYENIYKQKNVK